MKIFYGLAFCLFSAHLMGQSALRTSTGIGGGSVELNDTNSNRYVAYTIGQESIIGTVSSANHIVRQGFIQPPVRVLDDPSVKQEISAVIYPNPVEAYVTVSFNESVKSKIQARVYDLLGRLVLATTSPPQQRLQIDMANLQASTYLLQIEMDGRFFSAQLIKN